MTRLNDRQLTLLSGAAQRGDRAVVFAEGLPDAERARLAKALMRKGLVEEVAAKRGMPVHRLDDEGGKLSLVISDAGLTAIGVTDEAPVDRKGDRRSRKASARREITITAKTGAKTAARPPRKAPADGRRADVSRPDDEAKVGAMAGAVARMGRMPAPPASRASPASSASPAPDGSAPREGSKLASVIALLARPDGAGIGELTAATGWLPHTTRAALTGLRRRGYAVTRERGGEGASVYRIVAGGAQARAG